jgi:SAM-dependent methyltransferase
MPVTAEGTRWDEAYADRPPWDIGRPQPAIEQVLRELPAPRRLLDAGCGTGEHTLLAAFLGHDALGVDVSPRAIEIAREKAADRGVAARFEVGDARELDRLGETFEVVVDSGLFHVFDDADRSRYVATLAAAVRPGGVVHLMCFSDRQPGGWGPRRVTEAELRDAFSEGWEIEAIEPAEFAVNLDAGSAQAWLAAIRRSAGAGRSA